MISRFDLRQNPPAGGLTRTLEKCVRLIGRDQCRLILLNIITKLLPTAQHSCKYYVWAIKHVWVYIAVYYSSWLHTGYRYSYRTPKPHHQPWVDKWWLRGGPRILIFGCTHVSEDSARSLGSKGKWEIGRNNWLNQEVVSFISFMK